MTTATAETGRLAGSARSTEGASSAGSLVDVAGVGRAGLLARVCAAVALTSVGAHLWMGWEHRAMPWESALMFLMAAACLPCAAAVWRHGHERTVRMLFMMSLVMVALHAALLLAPGSMTGSHHAGMGAMVSTVSMGAGAVSGAVPHAGSMLGVVALELAVALLAACGMRQRHA